MFSLDPTEKYSYKNLDYFLLLLENVDYSKKPDFTEIIRLKLIFLNLSIEN